MTESANPPTDSSLRGELRTAIGFFRGLRGDLFDGAFAARPLPPLPGTLPQLQRVPEPLRSVARWLPHGVIVSLAFALALVTAGGWSFNGAHQDADTIDALIVSVTLVTSLQWRMGAWWLSFTVSWLLGANVSWGEAVPWTPTTFVSHIAVMMTVAARSRPRVAAEMWLLTTGLGLGFELTNNTWYSSTSAGMTVVSFLALLAVLLVRGWSETRREVVEQVAVTARERSKRTLLEERTTIARELHDVVAHHMSVVAIQAEAAPYRVENPPPELEKAFATIRENALLALSELRRVLGVVRAADYEAPDAPQPTLAELDGLLDNVREAGLEVEKVVTGAVRELPQGIELSAYRIIQEALSNSMRHAPGAAARVEISYVLGGIGLRIVNGAPTVRVPPSPGAGQGVTGMRERVAMLGGEMTAGPADDGGYETAVFIPVPLAGGPDDGDEGGEGEAT